MLFIGDEYDLLEVFLQDFDLAREKGLLADGVVGVGIRKNQKDHGGETSGQKRFSMFRKLFDGKFVIVVPADVEPVTVEVEDIDLLAAAHQFQDKFG